MAYYDPNQGYYDPNQAYYDPNQEYYDPYAGQYEEPLEDTESAKVRKEQAEKERVEALESNRLYLKKVRKRCVHEDFADLEQKQLFLFEILIESLEVNSKSDLCLSPPGDGSQAYVAARAQFLNSPYLEICENDTQSDERHSSYAEQNYSDYLQTVADAGQSSNKETDSRPALKESVHPVETELEYDVKWQNATGKSCLFSMAALEMIHDIDKYPVNIQVDRCLGLAEEGDPENRDPLGYTSIRLPDEFSMAVLQSLKPGVLLPVTSVHRKACDLRNVFGVKKGKAEVLVRLSAFGPVIITSFQSVGADRHYVFQPSPMASKGAEREKETPRSDMLKPIIAEEENAIGITIQKEADTFQKPVVWKVGGAQHGGCLDLPYSKPPGLRGSEFDSISLSRMPFPSETSLCRNIRPPTHPNTLKKVRNDLCDWHNLVSLEIVNNPGCNCGCLDKTALAEGDHKDWKCNLTKRLNCDEMMQPLPSVMGVGKQLAPVGCECDCPLIREALDGKMRHFRG